MRALPLLALALLSPLASAQVLPPTGRAEVVFPSVLGRGGAGVALPTRETALFVNPAHAAATPSGRFHLTLAGASVRAPARVGEARELVDEGELPPERLVDFTRGGAEAGATVIGPSVSFRTGAVGVAAGAFAAGTAQAHALADGPDAPVVASQRADGIGAAALAARIGETGLAIGAAARYVRRYAATAAAPADDADPLAEFEPVTGTAVAVDIGAVWQAPLRGLTLGAAAYDLGPAAITYSARDPYGLFDEGPDALAVELNSADAGPSLRVGAAYRLGADSSRTGLTFAADWVSAASVPGERSALDGLRLGVEGALGSVLKARAGFQQGRPSVGATLSLAVIDLDYAFYGAAVADPAGVPDDADRGFHHALQLRLGLD